MGKNLLHIMEARLGLRLAPGLRGARLLDTARLMWIEAHTGEPRAPGASGAPMTTLLKTKDEVAGNNNP